MRIWAFHLSPKAVFREFEEIVVIDTEYIADRGERPVPVCAVAHELKSGQRHRLWTFNRQIDSPPWPQDKKTLTVLWYGLAEFGFYLSMGWRFPVNVLDLHAEYSWFINGRKMRNDNHGRSLLNAMDAFGLDSMEAEEKEFWRNLIINRAWNKNHEEGILDYCEKDVHCTEKLLVRMEEYIDLKRALFRGSFIKSLSLIEQRGIPVDVKTFDSIVHSWPQLKEELIASANRIHPFYIDGTFKLANFDEYLKKNKIPWKRTVSGRPVTSSEYFRNMELRYPSLSRLRDIRDTLQQMNTLKIPIGKDQRNRFMQSPFRSITGRNQPSNSMNIFGGPKWMRRLIQPPQGMGMAYVDWSANEFGTAAGLSRDELMSEAYRSDCPYMWFAIKAGHAPLDATKSTHPEIRNKFKTLCLALMYGQGKDGIALRLGVTSAEADSLILNHKRTFKKFWEWSDDTVARALLNKRIVANCGWSYFVRSTEIEESSGKKRGPNMRSLMNWPMQTHGSEMMRMATILITKKSIACTAVVHDAFLVIDEKESLFETVEKTRLAMAEASRMVLKGFELKTDAEVFVHPERFPEERGIEVWNMLENFLSTKPQQSLF